jgi:hypothetical protein
VARSRWKKKHQTTDGSKVVLRSGLEKRTAEFLDISKVPYEYETVILEYVVPEKKHKYKPDFILGNGVIVEAKGRFDAATRQKMSLVIEQNPDKDIRLLFMRDNTISKSSKTKYSDWCEKRGIKYHVSSNGELPKEWLRESKPALAKPRARRNRRSLSDTD